MRNSQITAPVLLMGPRKHMGWVAVSFKHTLFTDTNSGVTNELFCQISVLSEKLSWLAKSTKQLRKYNYFFPYFLLYYETHLTRMV